MTGITEQIYRQVISVQIRAHKLFGHEYLPNIILLGHEEWHKLKAEDESHVMGVRDYENPKFMDIPIEIVNKENYFRIAYQWPLYADQRMEGKDPK